MNAWIPLTLGTLAWGPSMLQHLVGPSPQASRFASVAAQGFGLRREMVSGTEMRQSWQISPLRFRDLRQMVRAIEILHKPFRKLRRRWWLKLGNA